MASFRYNIHGKYDHSGVQQAQQGLQKLGQVAANVQKAFVGFMALKAIMAIGKGVGDSIKAYETQQAAIAKLTHAVNGSAKLTEGSLKRIVDYTSKMQGKTIFGDEVLQEQATLLAQMDMTEEQIKKTLQAAADLAGAGVGTLESNVKQLSGTLSGATGQLAKQVPALKGLTKEQLEAGAAIDLVAERYKGFAEVVAGTGAGKKQQIQNVMSDIKEKMGAIAEIGRTKLFGAALPILNKINDWLQEAIPKMINFFIHFPEVMKVVAIAVWNIIKKIFSIEFWTGPMLTYYTFIFDTFKSLAKILFNYFTMFAKIFWEPLSLGFEWAGWAIKTAWQSVMDALVVAINFLLRPVNSLLEGLTNIINAAKNAGAALLAFFRHPFDSDKREAEMQRLIAAQTKTSFTPLEIARGDRKDFDKPERTLADVGQAVVGHLREFGGSVKKEIDSVVAGVKEVGSAFGDVFGDTLSAAGDQLSEILGRELPEDIAKILNPVLGKLDESGKRLAANVEAAAEAVADISGGGEEAALLGESTSKLMGLFESLGQSVGIVAMIMGGWMKVALEALSHVLDGIMQVVQPFLDTLLRPLMGILRIIGRTLGMMLVPTLRMLEPVIELVTKAFIFLYNYAIRPFANAIIWVISTINNFIANVINGIIKLINRIPGVNIKWRMATMDASSMYLKKIDESDVYDEGGEAGGYSSTSGAAAQYTAVKDIIVNIYYQHSYVNGDTREIALNIRDEIHQAEKLGR